jgi:uncharacterized membrane protein
VALTGSSSVPPSRTKQATREGRKGEPPTRRWWPVLLPLVLVVIAASVYLPSGRHQWALSLSRQPTHYTVLAFSNAANLPAQTAISQPVTVSFAIGNREGRAEKYRYVLTQSPSKTASVLGQSTKSVAAGATWNVTTTIRPSCQSSPCRIQVSLPGHPEKIDFLVSLRTP